MSPEAAACPAAERLHVFSKKEVGGLIISLAVVNVLGILAALWLLCELPNYFGSVGPLVSFLGAGVALLADVAIAGLAWSVVRAPGHLADPAPARLAPSAECRDAPTPPPSTPKAPAPREQARGWTASSTAGSAA